MKTMRRTTCAPAVAVLMATWVLAACGAAPAPGEETTGPLAGDAAAIESAPGAASARTAAAIPGHDPAGPTRVARAPDAAPGGACPSPADEPAPIDGGREVTPGPEPEATVLDVTPAPVPPESTGSRG